MGWKKREPGNFFKFETPGDELAGTWLGVVPGRFGDNGQIRVRDGEVKVFSLTAALADLRNEAPGTRLRIVFTGMEPSAHGHQYKSFETYDFVDEHEEHPDPVPF